MLTLKITPPELWAERRRFLHLLGGVAMVGATPSARAQLAPATLDSRNLDGLSRLLPTPEAATTRYNNYYEFAFDKETPSTLASKLKTDPWTLEIQGLVEKPLKFDLNQLLKTFQTTERIYRFRCVEGWSAVLPWNGIPLQDLLLAANPQASAKYVAFTAVSAPDVMPNQKENRLLEWPYREGLRLDEALHPLTLVATGLYGKPLSPQNGAPLRLVVPWKYGFKSIKAIVRIELTDKQPVTTWNQKAPNEYGFFANVNPSVPHPRWSQATERPLASSLSQPRSTTLLFNGYEDQVAKLYEGLDLKRFF